MNPLLLALFIAVLIVLLGLGDPALRLLSLPMFVIAGSIYLVIKATDRGGAL